MNSTRVFVVDDDLSICKALKRVLGTYGFDVQTYRSGAEFLQTVPPQAEGCMVIDINMPEMDGYALKSRLQAAGFHMPTLFITADRDCTMSHQGQEPVTHEILLKPLDAEQLAQRIEAAMKQNAQL